MANSIKVVKTCRVQVSDLPSQTFSEDEVIQPWSPYYEPLLWAGLATDSGQPATPPGDVPTPLHTVVSSAVSQVAVNPVTTANLPDGTLIART